jgi:hypothetical protein
MGLGVLGAGLVRLVRFGMLTPRGVVDSLSSVYLRWEFDFGSLVSRVLFAR